MFEFVRQYCLSKNHVEEGFPFDSKTIVWKVTGKMFCLGNVENFDSINLKCNPQKAMELREQYTQIEPGYHMNKKHWNTVYFELLSKDFIREQLEQSYQLVFDSLSKKVKQEISYEK